MTTILGGGISGLSAAYYALENPRLAPMVILEASNRVGGWIRSVQLPDGAIFEKGPRTIRPFGLAGVNTLNMVEHLGLSDKVIPIKNNHPSAGNRLLYIGNKLHFLPNTFFGFFRKNTVLNRSFASLMWNDFKAPQVLKDDESIYSFVERRLGKEVADKVVSSMICGIYAGDAKQISVNFLMKSLFETEQKYGSIVLGSLKKKIYEKSFKQNSTKTEKTDDLSRLAKKVIYEKWAIWSLKGGLEQLPRTLADNLSQRGVNIETEQKCERLSFNDDHAEIVVNGEVRKCSRVVSSLPAKNLADLIQKQHPELSKELRAIPTVTVAVVNLQFPENVLPLQAFGLLVPPIEELPILGVLFDSCIFPQKSTVLTVMMGGAWFEKYFGKCSSEEHLVTVAVNQVREILRIEEDPMAFNVSVLKDCIPQHVVGHRERLNRIRNYIAEHRIPLALCGSSYQGVGLNDVILSAKEAVSDIGSRTKQ